MQTWNSTAQTTLLRQVDYRYDVSGRRIEKAVNSDGQGAAEIVERFVYDGDHIALAFNGSNQLTSRYLYGPGIDMILADEAFNPSTGNFIDTYWTLADHQPNGWRGNGQGPAARDALGVDRTWGTIPETRSPAALATNVLTHNAGTTTVAQRLAFKAFGEMGRIQDGAGNNVTTGPISRFAYTGREWGPETGNYFYRARYYDPQTGRFLSQDPIGFADGDMNLYRYVGNSTPNFTDPMGLSAMGMIPMPGRSGPNANIPVAATYGSGPSGMLPNQRPPTEDLSHLAVTTNAIGDPWSQDSVSQSIWAKIRKGAFDEALNYICHVGDVPGSNLGSLRDAMKQISSLGDWRKQISQLSLRDLKARYKTFTKTLSDHLDKRHGCDTPETMRLRYQLDFINEKLKERNKGGWLW